MPRIFGDLKERSLQFGADVMRALFELPNETRGWIIGKQLGRATTSIGANVWEADAAISDADFVFKIGIARKEAHEVQYWLELTQRLELLPMQRVLSSKSEAIEVSKILGAIVIKTEDRNKTR